MLSVHPSLPVKTLKELLALARARPGHLQYASAGVGTFQHLSAEMFKSMARVDIVHVPYKGGVPGYEANNWWGMLAPVGTPDAVVRKINAESNAVMMLADTQKRLASEGVETIATTPEQFGRHIAAEMAKWLKVTKDTNIKAE